MNMSNKICEEELNKLKETIVNHESMKEKLISSLQSLQEIVTEFNGSNRAIFQYVREKNLQKKK